MPDQPPVQHTPKHLEGEVFDSRHPAASAFAPAQPAAGVVANDADDRGQNLAGTPKADDAEQQFSDQKEVLAKQHEANLVAASGPVPELEAFLRSILQRCGRVP